jgi:hypothetical protein
MSKSQSRCLLAVLALVAFFVRCSGSPKASGYGERCFSSSDCRSDNPNVTLACTPGGAEVPQDAGPCYRAFSGCNCQGDVDCRADGGVRLVCAPAPVSRGDVCTPACNNDCGVGLVCTSAGHCVAATCAADGDCRASMMCTAGHCATKSCASDSDCGPYYCQGGYCSEVPWKCGEIAY